MRNNKGDQKKFLSRRNFFKSSATLAGGALISSLPAGAAAYVAGDDVIKIGLIGCGGRGTGAANQALSVKENVKLVAMADAFRDRLDESYENLSKHKESGRLDVPEENKFVGFDAYKQVMPLVDVLVIATPPGFRPIHFEEAIANDKHVFMEKPLATDAPGVRKILETAEIADQKNLNVVVGLQRHYQKKYREMISRIHDGAIGEITSAQAYWNSGGVWVRPRKPEQTEMEYQMRNWYYFNWLCGDHITEQHIHNLDVVNWAKQSYPVKAQGQGGREVRTGKEHGHIFDHHFVEFEYEDGAILQSQCRHIQGCWNNVAEAVTGTKGRANSEGVIKDLKGNVKWRHRGMDDPNPYQVEHDELFANIKKGGKPFNDAYYGAKSTMTSILGRMCTYSGQVITWDDAMNSNRSIMPERFAWDATPPVTPDENGYYPVPVPGKTEVL